MVGRNPVAFLHLEMPPEEVDVNVHPTKIEVRFRDSQRIYSQLLSTVRQTFLASDLHSRLQSPEPRGSMAAWEPQPSLASRPSDGGSSYRLERPDDRKQEVASWFAPGPRATPSSNPAAALSGYVPAQTTIDWTERLKSTALASQGRTFDEFSAPAADTPGTIEPEETPGTTSRDEVTRPAEAVAPPPAPAPRTPEGAPLRAIQVHDSYLIAETDDGMIVIDQHALHERILYEELRSRLEKGSVESQRLLVPEPVDVSGSEASALLEHREALAALGIELEPFGGDTVLVSSTPVMLAGVAPGRLLRDLAEHLRTRPLPPTRDALLSELLHMIACKAAIKAGQRLTPEEVAALLELRHLVADSHHCPHGRPTALVFTKSELERQFGRI